MSSHNQAWLEARAKARWECARIAFEANNTAEGWVNLLAMGMDMAAIAGEPLKDDLTKIARAGGLIP